MLKKIFNRFQSKKKATSVDISPLMATYNRLPVSFARGEGIKLWDHDDKEYFDALGGIAVSILGHRHSEYINAVKAAAENIIHLSNWYQIPEQEALANKLCEITQMDKVFLCNSGTEANEAALKIARKYGNDQNIENPVVITATNSFHGRTMAALAATGNSAIQKNFAPMLNGFIQVPYDDPVAIQNYGENKNVVAVMLEPILGESGIIIPSDDYLIRVREICDANNWLLIADEIQTGMGRTGIWCEHQRNNIKADIMTMAKALGNGIPIGACLARGKAAEVFQPGDHGTTFGGNPFACSVALNVIHIIERENLLNHAKLIGDYLLESLHLYLDGQSKVKEIRGRGLMLAVELNDVYPNLTERFLDHGLIVNITDGGKTIRLLPAAITNKSDADEIAKIIGNVINVL